MRATSDRTRLEAAINAAKVGSGATRYGPALKLAESILSRSPIKRREAVLISDFQRSGWSGSEEVRFPEGMTRQHRVGRVAGHGEPLGAVGHLRARVVLRPGAHHGHRRPQQQGRRAAEGRAGHADHRRPRDPDREGDRRGARVRLGRRSRSSRSPSPNVRGSVRAGTDPLPADNTFHFVLAPSEPVSLVIVDSGDRAGVEPVPRRRRCRSARRRRSRWTSRPRRALTPAALDKRAVVILNDTMFPPAGGGGALKRYRRARRRAARRQRRSHDVAAGRSGAAARPASARPSIARPDAAARSAISTTATRSSRCSRRRAAATSPPRTSSATARCRPRPADRVLARFDDGAVAAAERKIGAGRVDRLDVDARRFVDRHRA